MRVNTIAASSGKELDMKVNEFIENLEYEIIDIQFQVSSLSYSAMIIYDTEVEE